MKPQNLYLNNLRMTEEDGRLHWHLGDTSAGIQLLFVRVQEEFPYNLLTLFTNGKDAMVMYREHPRYQADPVVELLEFYEGIGISSEKHASNANGILQRAEVLRTILPYLVDVLERQEPAKANELKPTLDALVEALEDR